jgi:hypothetical protein
MVNARRKEHRSLLPAARGSYAKVIEIGKGESLRALCGLLVCEWSEAGVGGRGKGEGLALGDITRERIRQMYRTHNDQLSGHVEALIELQR